MKRFSNRPDGAKRKLMESVNLKKIPYLIDNRMSLQKRVDIKLQQHSFLDWPKVLDKRSFVGN